MVVVVTRGLGLEVLAGGGGGRPRPPLRRQQRRRAVEPTIGDSRGTQSGAQGVRNVALDVKDDRVAPGYGLNLYPLSCENGMSHSRGITVPRSASSSSSWATEADFLDIGHTHLRISQQGGRPTARPSCGCHRLPPYQITYQLEGRFTSAKTAAGTVRATVLEDTRGEDWLMPDFQPGTHPLLERGALERLLPVVPGRPLAPCLGTPEQDQEVPEPSSPPPGSEPGDEAT